MKLDVYALSNIGLKRTVNQDNYYCNGVCADIGDDRFRYSGAADASNPSFFAVFDGMGGYVHGERAAEIAVEEADKAFADYHSGAPEQLMSSVCASANKRICDEMRYAVKGRMGSTAVMILFENNRFYLCNLGDSPAFLLRNNLLKAIFCEHSERQSYEMIFEKKHSVGMKFKLTQHLGIFPDEMEIEPYFCSDVIKRGDIFLLCSDGLTDMVPENIIQSVLSAAATVREKCEKLLELSLQNGGNDNITIIACSVE